MADETQTAVAAAPAAPAPKKKGAAPANQAAVAMAKARAAIFKATGQKPLVPAATTMGYVSSGSFPIDMLIGGTPAKDGKGSICPGFPRRHITELYGPESSGKTTILISTMVQAQRAGGRALFIDFEHALDHNYAKTLGLSYDEDKLFVFQPDTLEEGFKMIAIGIASGFDIIGVDSVAAMVPKDELEKNFDDPAKIGILAAKLSIALPKFNMWLSKHPMEGDGEGKKSNPNHQGTALIFINQTRAMIGGQSHDTENTPGGKALKFYAYLRLRAARIKSEMIKRKDKVTGKDKNFPFGNLTDVKVVKSKIDAKQGHSTNIFIRFGYGIDDIFSIIETACIHKIVKREGAFYSLGDQRFQGKDKFRQFLLGNPKVYEAIKTKLVLAVNDTAIQAVDELTDDDEIMEFVAADSKDTMDEVEALVEETIAEPEE
jgi:recombination protein RecA